MGTSSNILHNEYTIEIIETSPEEEDDELQVSQISGTWCVRDVSSKVLKKVNTYASGSTESICYDEKGEEISRIRSLKDGKKYIKGKGRLLTLKEMFSMLSLINTELVVLSACESSLVGIRGHSDEFVGLPGGFLRAGEKSVIASLWVVDDRATSILMENFYKNYIHNKLPPSKALRLAQLELRKTQGFKNPFYWAYNHLILAKSTIKLYPR